MNNYNFIQDTGQSKTFGFFPAITGSFPAGNVIGGANPILISTPNQSMQGQLLGMQSATQGPLIDPATGRPAGPFSGLYQPKIKTAKEFRDEGLEYQQRLTNAAELQRQTLNSNNLNTSLLGRYSGGSSMGQFGGFRAEGGPVKEGRRYIVGEDGVEYYVDEDGNMVPVGLQGAELIEAPKDGFIIPNQDSQGFSSALLGQVTPTTPSEAGNKLLSPFGLSLGEQRPQPFGPVNQQAQPISILGQAPATPSGAVNQLRDAYSLAFADQQAQLNAQAQAQPLGPQSPFLPSGEKAVYAMTPEELAARQAARGGSGQEQKPTQSRISSFFDFISDSLARGQKQKAAEVVASSILPNATINYLTNPDAPSVGESIKRSSESSRDMLQTLFSEELKPSPTSPSLESAAGVGTILQGQVTPTIESITGVEQAQGQAQGQAPQPEATFTLPSGEVRSIMPGQDVASAFGRESGRPMTFQVDGGEVTVPSAQAIQTMNLGEQAAARKAQQKFLASPAAREMSNRMLRSVMYNDPYAQASREREARLAARPDFNRAVSDRERRGTGEMSKTEATRIAEAQGYKGQQARDVADGYIALQRQGRDPLTGKEVEAPFEPKEVEIGGKKYIQYTPNYIQPVEEPKAPKKSEIESIREEGVKAGLPENLIRQSIASKLGLDLFDEGVKNWMAGNTDTIPSVEGASETSAPVSNTIPTITSQEQYDALESGQTYIDSQGIRAVKK